MSYPNGYPQQGSHPGYPPQQHDTHPGYPAQTSGYPPQQHPGYPPQQHPGYPPQQPGYPPHNGNQGYPPQQHGGPGYPQQRGYPAPGHGPQGSPASYPHGHHQPQPGYPAPAGGQRHQPHGYPVQPHAGHAPAPGGFSGVEKPRQTVSVSDVRPDAGGAADEYVYKSGTCSSLDVIKDEYGNGMFVYFHYVKFLTAASTVMALFAALAWAVASLEGLLQPEKGEETAIHDFLLSAYPKSSAWAWYFAMVCQILIGFAIGPVYRKYQHIYTKSWNEQRRDDDEVRDDKIKLTDKHGAVIETTHGQRIVRKIVSIAVFLIVVALQGIGTWFLHKALSEQSDTTVAQIIAVCITILNMVYKKVGKTLTTFERHATWQEYREWDCGKMFVLKIFNLMVLYVVKQQTAKLNVIEQSFCPIPAVGTQFFWLIISDMTINNAIEFFIPMFMFCWKRRAARRSGHGDEFSKVQFDLAEEYVELLYRQFIVLLGMTTFPLITALGAIGYVLEYWLDKIRLVYLCKVPEYREEPLTANLVLAASLVVSVCCVVSYPDGALWVMSGSGMENCSFFK